MPAARSNNRIDPVAKPDLSRWEARRRGEQADPWESARPSETTAYGTYAERGSRGPSAPYLIVAKLDNHRLLDRVADSRSARLRAKLIPKPTRMGAIETSPEPAMMASRMISSSSLL